MDNFSYEIFRNAGNRTQCRCVLKQVSLPLCYAAPSSNKYLGLLGEGDVNIQTVIQLFNLSLSQEQSQARLHNLALRLLAPSDVEIAPQGTSGSTLVTVLIGKSEHLAQA